MSLVHILIEAFFIACGAFAVWVIFDSVRRLFK